MKTLVSTIAIATALATFAVPAKAASFDCTADEHSNATERKICGSATLGALDERLDSWYRRALVRAGYFDQTAAVRRAQRDWIASRNACGGRFWCIRRHYVERIRDLEQYVEHV